MLVPVRWALSRLVHISPVGCASSVSDPSVTSHLACARILHRAAGITGDKVDRSRRRRPERGPVGIVVHREVLRVVPECGGGVAVVVTHYQVVRMARVQRKRRCSLLR